MTTLSKTDVFAAKAILDNHDQIAIALATLSQQRGGSVTITVSGLTFTFEVAALVAFLTAQNEKASADLFKSYNVTTG